MWRKLWIEYYGYLSHFFDIHEQTPPSEQEHHIPLTFEGYVEKAREWDTIYNMARICELEEALVV